MTTEIIPVLRVASVDRALPWWARLGFTESFRHQFEPDFPVYCGITRDGSTIHLSEHTGDARPDTLVYLHVDDLDGVAAEFGAPISDNEWGRDLEITDPDRNRLRIGETLG